MDPQLKALLDKYSAAGASDDELRQVANEWKAQNAPASESTNATAPGSPDEINPGNLIRAAVQGGTFHLAGATGLIDRQKEAAFEKQHGFADALAQLVGGGIIPGAAATLIPQLATLPGIVGMGAAGGGVMGAADGTDMKSRLEGAGVNALLGGGAAAAGYGAQKVIGNVIGRLMQSIAPEMMASRSVGQLTKDLLTPAEGARVQTRMNAVNAIAPGGSSPASAAVPEIGDKSSRFAKMANGLGASPEAAAQAEATLAQQTGALKQGAQHIGRMMDVLDGDMNVTPELRAALKEAKPVLGNKTPTLTEEEEADVNPLGLEKSTPVSFAPDQETMRIQDARDALSRLRYMSRVMSRRGIDANGVSLHEVNAARDALENVLYAERPDLQQLDQSYAKLADEQRSVNRLRPIVQRSRASYASNKAYGVSSGSLGGSLPRGSEGVMRAAADHILSPNTRPAVADATAATIMRPGTSIQSLLDAAPKPSRVGRAVRAGIATSLPPALKGLLFPVDDEPQQPQP